MYQAHNLMYKDRTTPLKGSAAMGSKKTACAMGLLACLAIALTYEGFRAASPSGDLNGGVRSSPKLELPDPHPQHLREILWRPDATGPSPFGYIPTQWTVRPQLLPTAWDVQIVLTEEDLRR
jgi:hypothetical protein